MNFLIILLCIGIGNYASTQTLKNKDIDNTAPENLDDRDDMSERETCTVGESCDFKRMSSCTKEQYPHTACGQKIWKEEFFGCYDCAGGVWLDGAKWSECSGTGCNDTVQQIERRCANKAANVNCRSVQTRFCDSSQVCHGTWTEWKSDSPECKDICGANRYRVLHRDCMKDGKSSISCESKNAGTEIRFKQTDFDQCLNTSCQTTTESTTTTTTKTTTTTRRATTLTEWSNWEGCTATCTSKLGTEKRTRKCVYDDKQEAPVATCGRSIMSNEQNCVLQNTEKCKVEKSLEKANVIPSSTTTKVTQSTTMPKAKSKSAGTGSAQERVLIVNPSLDQTTKSPNATISTTEKMQNNQAVEKWQIRVLIIVLATTALLILLVIVIYICCGKRRRKVKKKRKINSISVVGLQSHTGFMDGMEKYGFTKTMMPKDDFLTALNPTSQSNPELNVDTYNTKTPDRELPEIPVEEHNHANNQNSHHIYEEMTHPNITPNRSYSVIANRSKSYHERRRANTLMSSSAELQPLRRKSCFTLQPKRSPPIKPPRKSMYVTGSVDINANREMRNVPKSLYDSKERISCPDLDFIHDIQPPTTSPPITPLENDTLLANRFLTLPNMGNNNSHMISAHSAPVSPNHYPLSPMQQTQYFTCLPNSLLVPYGAMPLMTPVQNQNGEVVYMPVTSMYSSTTPVHMQQTLQPTPLHGAAIPIMNRQNSIPHAKAPLPPQISISEADPDKNHLSPQRALRSPNSGDYAEMRHVPSISAPPDFDDADSCFVRSRSFRQLHGTHNLTQSPLQDSDDNLSKKLEDITGNNEIYPLEEDEDLYLTPNSPRTPVA